MSDLIRNIRAAQIAAGEAAVLESLRESGLLADAKPTLADLKSDMLAKIREAEKAAYAYFCECDVGPDRERAHDIYENVRNATRE
ncbi:hypothetical protein NDK50_08165 [Paraburkholderia bryophila]|uniref:hypothetical protein n=1 Tax=Paraburkholderia bryophila TaxID=420952 RepID=UPI0023490560|nr:hypothetical protein [Paraburkholderia bryophila]WCM21411.1 hypothetical protein NDK50_08165 [Paraburkholderia bryophila]